MTPPLLLFLFLLLRTVSSFSYRVVFQENVRHQPFDMCLNDISPSPVYLRACASSHSCGACLRGRTGMKTRCRSSFEAQTESKKINKIKKFHVNHYLLPTACACVRVCVRARARRWPLVPWSCGLNCMPVLMSSYQSKRLRESAHDCLIHTMQNWNCCSTAADYGYSYTCTNWNPDLACIVWFTCANHEAIEMGISILYFKIWRFLLWILIY